MKRYVQMREPRSAGAASNPSGFSLLELLVVMMIVCLLAAIAIPTAQTAIEGYELSNAVENASLAIQATRYQAIMQGYPYQIVFDAEQNTYQVLNEMPGTTAFANVGSAVPISGAPIALTAPITLQFSPNGSVAAISGPMTLQISYMGNSKTVTVYNYGSTSISEP